MDCTAGHVNIEWRKKKILSEQERESTEFAYVSTQWQGESTFLLCPALQLQPYDPYLVITSLCY